MRFRSISSRRRVTRSSLFIPIEREIPREAEIPSHQLLLRGGYIRRTTAAGLFMLLPLAVRSLTKIENIIDEEMQNVNAQKLSMPLMLSSDLWKKTGRWESTGAELIRFRDRHDNDFCLSPTHEELFTDLISNEVKSYKHFPLSLYQIGKKYRDEIRPRFGLLRSREFIMKDCYSFHLTKDDATDYYYIMGDAYKKILDRIGCSWVKVEADSGNIGGSLSHEFHIKSNIGEDELLLCNTCNYAANVEKASSKLQKRSGNFTLTIANENNKYFVFLYLKERKINSLKVKSLLLPLNCNLTFDIANKNNSNNDNKNKNNDQDKGEMEKEKEEDFVTKKRIDIGECKIIVDANSISGIEESEIQKMIITTLKSNGIKFDNVINYIEYEKGDIDESASHDYCAVDGCKGTLESHRGIEVGHIFYLSKKYSEVLDASVLDVDKKKITLEMGCYGIGVTRMLAAVAENMHDEKGISWPETIAPYKLIIITVAAKKDLETIETLAKNIYDRLNETTLKDEIVLDDRFIDSFGSKLTEAELIGYPFVAIVGRSALQDGETIELIQRRGGKKVNVKIDEIVNYVNNSSITPNSLKNFFV